MSYATPVVLISADMEGATGVTCPDDVLPGSVAWQRMRHLFTGDVNAVITGLFDGGAGSVLVNDAHATMRNLLIEELDPRAELLSGRHKPLGMMQGVEGVDGVAFVGYHAAAGCPGVLAHTYLERSIVDVKLDGRRAGEGDLNAALAREEGVPVILVSGDDVVCADAAVFAPSAETASVKRAVSRYAAICLPPETSSRLLRTAAEKSVLLAVRGERVEAPHRIDVEFDAVQLADAVAIVPTVERISDRCVAVSAPSMKAAMQAFKIITVVARAAREHEFD